MRQATLRTIVLLAFNCVLMMTSSNAAPLLKMQFSTDTVGNAPQTAPAVQGGVSTKPTNCYVYTDTSILIRQSPIDSLTNEMFESSKVVEILDNSTTYSPCISFNGDTADVAGGSDKVRIDLDMMIDSTVPRTGNLFVNMKQVNSNTTLSQITINFSSGKINLANYDPTGTFLNSTEVGYAPIGKSIHLQIQLDYSSGVVTVKADGLVYISDAALVGPAIKTGTFAKNISFGRLDLASGTTAIGKVWFDNISINVIPNLPTRDVSYYGAAGNGTTDDTTALQTALSDLGSSIGKLTFGSGKTYKISKGLTISTGRKDFAIDGRGAIMKFADGSPISRGWGILIYNAENFTIENLTIDGNRGGRTPAEVYAHGIMLQKCSLFTLSNIICLNAVCDGFYVEARDQADSATFSRNGHFINCKVDNCYRQGMSIINGHHLYVINGEYSNSNGTAPEAGIDIEANPGTDEPGNMDITIRNAKFYNNAGYGVLVTSKGKARNITIEDSYFSNSTSENPSLGGIGVCSEYSLFRNNFFENYDGCYFQPNGTVTRGIIDVRSTQKFNSHNLISNNWFNHIKTGQAVIYVHGDAGDYNKIVGNVILDFDWNDLSGIYVSVNNPTTVLSGNRTTLFPIGHWQLDQASGYSVPDSSGNSINGTTYNGPLWVLGYYDNALSFNGINQYVQIANDARLNVTDCFTLSAWIYADAGASTAQHTVIGKSSDFRFGFSGGVSSFGLYSAFGIGRWVCSAVTKGAWHHVAATYNGSRVRLYIDGTLAKDEVVKPGSVGTSQRVCIGSYGGTTYPFDGIIDDVRIYDVALSSTEIDAIKNNHEPYIPE